MHGSEKQNAACENLLSNLTFVFINPYKIVLKAFKKGTLITGGGLLTGAKLASTPHPTR